MALTRLADSEIAELRSAPFTYDGVGRTAGEFPSGFASLHRVRTLPQHVELAAAAQRLMSWQLHTNAGLRVAASGAAVEDGAVVVLGIGPRALRVAAPCRVVYVVDTPTERGFAYGTLRGHPESGEERFVVRLREDGRVELSVDAFSRPNSALTRLGGPAARRVQARITDRYLRALDG